MGTPRRPEPPQGNDRDRFRGCLLGGAVRDALGAPVEFLSLAQIRERFGPGGIRDYAPAYGRVGAITGDTQMTLFTAEGLLRAIVRMKDRGIGGAHVALVKDAYMRWLEPLALRAVITEVADDFLLLPRSRIGDHGDAAEREYWCERYPAF
jgi:ADP-ribosylglycohydrolase